ncbi:MAG: acyltransferase family protein [Cyanobacteria bacterium J06643_13]
MRNKQNQRLSGIDFFRGLAIFAVILLHADEGVSVTSGSWRYLLNFAEFAVPFFLATSFWLAMGKSLRSYKPAFWGRITKLTRFYLLWTGVYLLYRLSKYMLLGESEQLRRLQDNLWGIIFTGDAAFHLYFLPLLILGIILLSLLPIEQLRSLQLGQTIFLSVSSIVLYQLLLHLDSNWGLQNWRSWQGVGFTWLTWIVRSGAYIAIALTLNHERVRSYYNHSTQGKVWLWLIIFLALNLVHAPGLLLALQELARGYSALILAIFGSRYRLCHHAWIQSLSKCSFGIYLVHLLLVEGGQILENRLLPTALRVNTPNLLLFTSICLLMSWWLVAVLSYRPLGKIAFRT